MDLQTETLGPGACIVSEANGTWSRKMGVIASGNKLLANAVIAAIAAGTAAATAAPSNAGDGTMGAITVAGVAQPGDYVLTFLGEDADAGDFQVEAPDGTNVGAGTVGTEFTGGGLTFTLADGAADFAEGDQFTITVVIDAAATRYVPFDPAGTDGSEVASAILYDDVDATDADADAVILHRELEINPQRIVFAADVTEQQKAAALAQLEARGITAL